MIFNLKKLPKKEYLITVEVPWEEVKKKKDQALKNLAKTIEIKGFRKGNAPPKMVEKHISPDKLVEGILQELLPFVYTEAIKKHNLKPIVSPQIKPVSFEENKSWQFEIRTAEAPDVSVDEYEKIVKEAKKAEPEIWTPDKKGATKKELSESEKLGKILEAMLKHHQLELSDLIIEQETNRLLSQALEDIKALGITLDAYLASTGKTAAQLRREYRQKAERTLKLEFILQAVSEKVPIKVSQEDIDQVIEAQKDERLKNQLRADSYAVANMIRRQKTLTHLLQL